MGMKRKKKITAWLLCAGMIAGCLSPAAIVYGQPEEDSALSKEAYADFGMESLTIPEKFTSDEEPLSGYEGIAMSRLYVGYMNKNNSQTGSYALYNTMLRRSKNGATISGSHQSGYLDAAPVIPETSYPNMNSDAEGITNAIYRTLNSVSLNMGPLPENPDGSGGGNQPEIIADSILFRGKQKGKTTSFLCVQTNVSKGVQGYGNISRYYIKLSDDNGCIDNLDTRAAQGVNAVTAGDFDGDQADELAVYVPHFTAPYIQIFDIGNDGSITPKGKIQLNQLAADDDPVQYGFGFKNWMLPIVNLNTTSMSREVVNGKRTGREHLVITAGLPRTDDKSYKNHSRYSVLAVFDAGEDVPTRLYKNHLSYRDYYMRFPATVEADVNGSGTDELVVAGYADTCWGDEKFSARPFSKYCVNLLLYDEKTKTYGMAYDEPLEYVPTGDGKKVMAADSRYAMTEPVALEAARLSVASGGESLFLEGSLIKFNPAKENMDKTTESGRLENGKLEKQFEMAMKPKEITVSHAVSGRFAMDYGSSEQIALVWNDTYNSNSSVDCNITWLWAEGNQVRQYDTNYQYLKGRNSHGNGTFLSLCRVGDTASQAIYEYEGKAYGWSKPNALIGFAAIPYWKELPYESGMGSVSFNMEKEISGSLGSTWHTDLGVTASVSAMVGAAALGNKALAGAAADFDMMFNLSVGFQGGLSLSNARGFEVPGDDNYVIVYATPVATYKYNVWLPSFTLTKEHVEKYKELVDDYDGTIKGEDGAVYSPGQTVPAGWHSYNMHVPGKPTYSMIPMEQYNEAYTKHALGTGKIDMAAYDFTVGDPTTYKENFKDIPHYNDILKMSSGDMYIAANQQTNNVAFGAGGQLNLSAAVGLDVSMAVKAAIEAEVQLGPSGQITAEFGQKIEGGNEIAAELGLSINLTTGASISPLPAKYNDYSFQTTAGVWPCIGHGPLVTMNYIVKQSPKDIPKPPEHPYVYEAGVGKNKKPYVVLAWDMPKSGDYRLAEEYEVYYKLTHAPVSDYQFVGKVNSLEQNFMLISGLNTNAVYDFAFRAVIDAKHKSGYSIPLTLSTHRADTLSVTLSKPEDVYAKAGAAARFEVEASDSGNRVTYQWQKYEPGSIGYVGEWENIEGAVGASYEIHNVNEKMDGTKYRAIVSAITAASARVTVPDQTVTSRAATLHVGDGTDPRYHVELLAHDADGNEWTREDGGAYFLSAGDMIKLHAKITARNDSAVNSGTITYYCKWDQGAEEMIGKASLADGTAEYEWTPEQSGYYKIVAVYTPVAGNREITSEAQDQTPDEISVEEPEEILEAASAEESEEPETVPEEMAEEELTAASVEEPEEELAAASVEELEEEIAAASVEEPEEEFAAVSAENPEEDLSEASVDGVKIAVSDVIDMHVGTIIDEIYQIQYRLDGGTNDSANISAIGKGGEPYKLKEPTKEGSVFGGWYTEPEFINEVAYLVPEDISAALEGDTDSPYELYAKWNAEEYSVTYDVDGGIAPDNPSVYTQLQDITLKDAEREGYRFTGWYFESSAAGADVDSTVPVTSLPLRDKSGEVVVGDIVLRAGWEAIEYPIDYQILFGKNHEANPTKYTVEDELHLRSAIYGYNAASSRAEFDGWYADADYTNKITFIPKGTTGPLTLYAKPRFGESSICFLPLGGAYEGEENPVRIKPGEDFVLGTANRQGFDFNVWSEKATVSDDEEIVAETGHGTATYKAGDTYRFEGEESRFLILYAAWTPAEGQVEIQWIDTIDRDVLHHNYGVKGNTIQELNFMPEHEGYSFTGWYEDEKCTRPWDFEKSKVPSGLEDDKLLLYAGFEENAKVKSISLTPSSLTLELGKSEKLKAVVTPESAGGEKVTWTTSNKKVATVTASGQVKAVKAGTASITCTAADGGGAKATCKVTVKNTATPLIILKGTAGKKSVRLNWNQISNADGYEIYGSRCGSNSTYKKIKTIKKGTTKTWTQSGLKSAAAYKYYVKAYKLVNGKKLYLRVSKTSHVSTTGGSYTNAKTVTATFTDITLAKGKTRQISARITPVKTGGKLANHVPEFRYKTTNSKVATVTESGKIKAAGKGKCSVYVYANNGVTRRIRITVK